jgi:DNA topoisomerase-1
VIKSVSKRLANTPAICRKCYVHPIVVERFLENQLPALAPIAAPRMLRADERRFLKFLADQPASSS